MLVICKDYPDSDFPFPIEKVKDAYFCYPSDECYYLELISLYGGNHYDDYLDLGYTPITTLPDTLKVTDTIYKDF